MKNLTIFFVFILLFPATAVSGAADAFVTRNLNLRTGPSTKHALRGLIPAGEAVFVQTCKGTWCHIKYKTQTGWVSSRYLAFKDSNALYHTYTVFSGINRSIYSYSP